MGALSVVLAVLAATVLVVPLADRLRLPFPLLMLVFGLLLAVVPGVPVLEVNPELILPLLLPPLLYSAARATSWLEFKRNWRAITLLAVALVLVTAFTVGIVLQALVPGLPFAAVLVFGAMVGPPDPVAATAVAAQLRLPRRLTNILVGEGLFNDATALILYDVALAAVVTGAFMPLQAGSLLLFSGVAGIGFGFALAWLSRRLLDLLPAQTSGAAVSLLMPFIAYVAADELHGSGVLAVLVYALTLRRSEDQDAAATRTQAVGLWQVVEFLVTGAAFAFVGLELRAVSMTIEGDVGELISQTAVISAVVILVRFAWIFPVGWLNERTRAFGGGPDEDPVDWREMLVASWSGMRGVVTLATALALPLRVEDGGDFPERDRLILLAFGVIIVTLLIQGLTLPLLVRALGVQSPVGEEAAAERELTRAALDAGRERLEEIRRACDIEGDLVDEALELTEALRHRLDSVPPEEHDADAEQRRDRISQLADLEAEMLAAARRTVIAARRAPGADPRVTDEVLSRLDARGIQPRVLPESEQLDG
ncbi:MAG: Na+/H+ antiporter [Geodermatophilaceae bacterium]|nr:Na+/H+ antiporter [Geodermatophilaceae bacterium]